MDHWLKTGSFSKRKTTKPTDSQDMPSSVTNPAEEYFPKCEKGDHWIAFPFSEKYFESAVLSVREKEKLIVLKTNSSLEVIFEKILSSLFGLT
ncbi:unnamed protein product [Macrosiphum euphorbiae]|uniref:Uncharacterized protein n=1 Tax=Macrosiphum euphorbiae TaxID=13131 RepID=A0AAV0WQW8_9HEMI|nr:unnamed protein product [Macrosiphum euphorbiae]